ncbi:putative transmembrane ascorbate ferrireductase 3 [Drosera capensis]
MEIAMERKWYRQSTSRITVVAHFFGGLPILLMLVWLLHFGGGIDLNSDIYMFFDVHPFLMFSEFIFFAGEAMMAYKTVAAQRAVQKFIHMALHLGAITFGIVGVYAAFKYHNLQQFTNMYTLHSWLGLCTFILYGIQWLFGLFAFWVPQDSEQSNGAAMACVPRKGAVIHGYLHS